jgi:hypothetical protein
MLVFLDQWIATVASSVICGCVSWYVFLPPQKVTGRERRRNVLLESVRSGRVQNETI